MVERAFTDSQKTKCEYKPPCSFKILSPLWDIVTQMKVSQMISNNTPNLVQDIWFSIAERPKEEKHNEPGLN